MAREREGIEQVRYVVDWFRGFGFLVLLGVIGVAGIRAGGWQGWILGAVFLLLVIAVGGWFWVRRDDRY
jgi:hypothetical protein